MMKKILSLFIAILPLAFFGCGRGNAPLTQQQRLEDFFYIYETLNDNYPYFELRQRRSGLDWLGNKEKYTELVENAQSDTAHLFAISEMLGQLHDGHLDIYPTVAPGLFAAYAADDFIEEHPDYMPWKEAVELKPQRLAYWSGIYGYDESESDGEPAGDEAQESNYSDTVLLDKGIAIMTVPSLERSHIDVDRLKTDRFFENLDGVRTIIIDIQGNGGGSTKYWTGNIVSRLIQDTVRYAQYFAIKPGEVNRKFYAKYFAPEFNTDPGDPFLELIPEQYRSGYRLVTESETVAPRDPVDFTGDIYLLVDGSVFSSAEGFASFAKSNGWATVAGRRTAGDGIGSDPVIVTLPSGIKMRFPVTAGFNPDGSLNTEYGTTPDILLEGATPEARLQELIDKVSSR